MKLNEEEVISYYTQLKKDASTIQDPIMRRKVILDGLNKYSLSDWCYIGQILKSADLL